MDKAAFEIVREMFQSPISGLTFLTKDFKARGRDNKMFQSPISGLTFLTQCQRMLVLINALICLYFAISVLISLYIIYKLFQKIMFGDTLEFFPEKVA